MKRKLIAFTILCFASACTDLDLLPADGNVDAVVFKDPAAYRSYLAKIYAAFSHTGQQGPAGRPDITIVSDEGFTSYIRAYWKAQELTTDEAVIAWTDAGIRDLHSQAWSADNQFVRVIYYRIFYIIAYANDFLGQSTPAVLSERGISSSDQAIIMTYRAEARFLRALAYWHALDLFRNVPILTKISADLPSQATPQQLFDHIEAELIAIESELADPMQNEYGRADRAALWMLQAKLYLNAESMGVTLSGSRNAYTETAAACQRVFDEGYSIAPIYNQLFLADNHQFKSTEFIFTLPQDGIEAQNWGGTTFLVHAGIGGRMEDNIQDSDNTTAYPSGVEEDVELYGVNGGWRGMRTTSSMVAKFSNVAPSNLTDPRGIFYTNGQSLAISDIAVFEQGYAVPKFKNITSTGEKGKNVTHADNDYPMFRLADTYLMYAEAVARGGTGSLTDATGYINELRDRAYGVGINNIIEADLTLDFILDERVRELYWEGTRRLDLIRFGKFAGLGEIIWPWKGGVEGGTSVEAYRKIFPIPTSDLAANPKLEQNDNY